MKNTKLVSQDVVNRDHELTGIVDTSEDVLDTAQRDLDQHRWEQVACSDNPNKVTQQEYANAVGLTKKAVSISKAAWEKSVSYDTQCSGVEHGGTELTEAKKPTAKAHKKARNRASVGELNVAVAEGLRSAFGVDTAVSSVSRNGNWQNRRNAVKELLRYSYPNDKPAQIEGAQSAADEVRTEWLRIAMALEAHNVGVPTIDSMLNTASRRWEREQDFSFRTAVDTELKNLATELKAKAKKNKKKKSAHSIRYMEASSILTTIKDAYVKLLDIVDGVEFDDEERELLGADLAEAHRLHVEAVDATDTEDVIIGIQMDALTNTEE